MEGIRMNFLHMADMHLGYRQYDLEQRFLDFGHTFEKIIDYAIAHHVEFVLISGDLFDRRSINAPTFIQANHVLSKLRQAGIPCIAIEGNHDRRFVKDGMSWLESLEWENLLRVIKNYEGNLMGGYIDVGKTRVFGYGFAGALTPAAIPAIKREIQAINATSPPQTTILMLHVGVQGSMRPGVAGEVTYEELCPLRGVVDYLALGHYHNSYEIDGWAHNPGSPDTCSIAEATEKKGVYHVTDAGARLIAMDTRRFIPLRIRADGHKDFESLFSDVRESAARHGRLDGPVVLVTIAGTLGFDRSHVNTDAIAGMVEELTGALHVDVRFDLANDAFSIAMLESDGLDRPAIEREVFRKLALSDSMLADSADLFAAAAVQVRDLAVRNADDKTLDEVLRKIYGRISTAAPEAERAPEAPAMAVQDAGGVGHAKKPGKKAAARGQATLGMGDGP